MIKLLLIGIGTGNPDHITLQAIKALQTADLILLPLKGDGKSDLAEVRRTILTEQLQDGLARIVAFEMPTREPNPSDYIQAVETWHDEIAASWTQHIETALLDKPGTVALLVWGDPSLYDSTLRIAERLKEKRMVGEISVIPGVTSISALTAAHAMPLNTLGDSVVITTGRQLRDHGWPTGADTVVVMLDGQCTFATLLSKMPEAERIRIWWGAYLGLPFETILHGSLGDMSPVIIETRRELRARHGWIMDTYVLRRTPSQ
ncbi:MAG: precorrin-6A synthase (deacetylating) [Pseudomonadota bacterium]